MTSRASFQAVGADIAADYSTTGANIEIHAGIRIGPIVCRVELTVPADARVAALTDSELCSCLISGNWPRDDMTIDHHDQWFTDCRPLADSAWSRSNTSGPDYIAFEERIQLKHHLVARIVRACVA